MQTPNDLRAIADAQAAILPSLPDPIYAAFLCMALYGAADELDHRQAAARDGRPTPKLSVMIRDKQLVRLRTDAPLRAPAVQLSDEGLALFDAGRQGSLL